LWKGAAESKPVYGGNCTQGFAAFDDSNNWLNFLGATICLVCAATAAGLTLGLVSLDPLELELKFRAGTSKEQAYAAKVSIQS